MVDFNDLKNMIYEGNVDHLYMNNPQCYMIKATDLVSMLNTVEENVKYCFKIELLDTLEGYIDDETYELIESILEEF